MGNVLGSQPYKGVKWKIQHKAKPSDETSARALYVLLKALPPVCMKYTARNESRVANIARGEAECYICCLELYLSQDSHQELYTFIQIKWQCFKYFVVFYAY